MRDPLRSNTPSRRLLQQLYSLEAVLLLHNYLGTLHHAPQGQPSPRFVSRLLQPPISSSGDRPNPFLNPLHTGSPYTPTSSQPGPKNHDPPSPAITTSRQLRLRPLCTCLPTSHPGLATHASPHPMFLHGSTHINAKSHQSESQPSRGHSIQTAATPDTPPTLHDPHPSATWLSMSHYAGRLHLPTGSPVPTNPHRSRPRNTTTGFTRP
jgi:hypothetical protein